MPADVANTLAGWLSTSGSNAPSGSTSVSTNLDDNLREMQGVVVRGLSHKGADIASAATTDIGAVEGLMHDITGTTTITALGTVREGILKILKFEGALTLTHNAASLILPGGTSILTVDGDIAIFVSEGSGNWRCVGYQRTSFAPSAGFPSGTAVVFAQTSAPTGWTKGSTHNDKSLRVVSGTASSGGATAFSSVFGSGKTTGAHTLTTSEMPSHDHAGSTVGTNDAGTVVGAESGSGVPWKVSGGAGSTVTASVAAQGGGGSHDHTLSLDLQYVDVIIATKDAG